MKKLYLFGAIIMALIFPMLAFANQPVMRGDTVSAFNAVSITDQLTTHGHSRGVWIGTTQSIDLFMVQDGGNTGAWVTFQGATAGTLIPIQAAGARKTSGPASPSAGDIVFLY